MEKALKLAIEGGYKKIEHSRGFVVYKDPIIYDLYWVDYDTFPHQSARRLEGGVVREDPLFWQALGKSLGWDIFCGCSNGEFDDKSEKMYCPRCMWHRFIDSLAEGKSPDSFFEELL